jgi:hypothetical protein
MKHLHGWTAALAILLASCGGGGGGGVTTTGGAGSSGGGGSGTGGSSGGSGTSSAATVTNFVVDDPVQGLGYTCFPSQASGVTGANGGYTCDTGDTSASFSLNGGQIPLGQLPVPAPGNVSLPLTNITMNGQIVGVPVLELLRALDHGTAGAMNVGGVSIPAGLASDLSAFVSSAGVTLPAGKTLDEFVASVQAGATLPVGSTFAHAAPAGAGNTWFAASLAAVNTTVTSLQVPAPPFGAAGTTTLTGTLVVTGSGKANIPGCSVPWDWTSSGGGLLKATVSGDVQKPGRYAVSFVNAGFSAEIKLHCNALPNPPDQTIFFPVSPLNQDNFVTVTAAGGQDTLELANAVNAPAGCTGGTPTGVDAGASGPLIRITTSVTCDGALTVPVTANLVSAW